MKRCKVCGEEKEESAFVSNGRKADGTTKRKPQCTECWLRLRDKNEHREHARRYMRERRIKHLETFVGPNTFVWHVRNLNLLQQEHAEVVIELIDIRRLESRKRERKVYKARYISEYYAKRRATRARARDQLRPSYIRTLLKKQGWNCKYLTTELISLYTTKLAIERTIKEQGK